MALACNGDVDAATSQIVCHEFSEAFGRQKYERVF